MLLLWAFLGLASCKDRHLPNQEMVDLLKIAAKTDHNHENVFSPEAMIEYCDSILSTGPGEDAQREALSRKANAY